MKYTFLLQRSGSDIITDSKSWILANRTQKLCSINTICGDNDIFHSRNNMAYDLTKKRKTKLSSICILISFKMTFNIHFQFNF